MASHFFFSPRTQRTDEMTTSAAMEKKPTRKGHKAGVHKLLKKQRAQSKSAKSKIAKLDRDTKELDDIRQSLTTIKPIKLVKALDSAAVKAQLQRDAETREKNKKAEHELALQMALIDSMGL